MLINILLCGIIVEIVFLLFTKDKFNFTISMVIGLFLACIMAIHMSVILEIALDRGSEGAMKYMMMHNIIRYIVLLIIFALIIWSGYLNPLYAFLGLITLKLGAYLVPITSKIHNKIKSENKEN